MREVGHDFVGTRLDDDQLDDYQRSRGGDSAHHRQW